MQMTVASRRKVVRVGPEDHGRRMSLDDFDRAIPREGYLYELAKGVVEVSDIPGLEHLAVMQEIRNQLIRYQLSHRDVVHTIASGSDCKVLLHEDQSERHPDISVYLDAPPEVKDVWSVWVPAIVIEVVSERSTKRDYEDKPPEYLSFGVKEYWIVDNTKRQMTVLQRWRGKWRPIVVKVDRKYTTLLLPKFSLNLKKVFRAK